MDLMTKFLIFAVVIAYYALLFWVVRRSRPISLERQLREAVSEGVILGRSFMDIVSRSRRAERRFVADYHRLSADTRATALTHEFVEHFATHEGTGERPAPQTVAAAVTAMTAAAGALRMLLGTLTDDNIAAIARRTNDRHFGWLDEAELRAFLVREREGADDATEQDILGHHSRFTWVIIGLLRRSCQPAEKTV